MFSNPLWEKIPFKKPRIEDEIHKHFLSVPIFEGLRKRHLKAIQALCHVRQYKKDEPVFYNGDPGAVMFVILEGEVLVYNDEGPVSREFAHIFPGDFLGDLALLVDLPRTASARALTFTRAACFARSEFLDFIKRNPVAGNTLLLNMSRLIGSRLIYSNQEVEKVVSRNYYLEKELETLVSKKRKKTNG